MASNVSYSAAGSASGHDESAGFFSQAVVKVRQSLCGMHGHDSLLHFEHDRMFLRCTSCGHETPGWEIGNEPRENQVSREPVRPVSMPRWVGARKVA